DEVRRRTLARRAATGVLAPPEPSEDRSGRHPLTAVTARAYRRGGRQVDREHGSATTWRAAGRATVCGWKATGHCQVAGGSAWPETAGASLRRRSAGKRSQPRLLQLLGSRHRQG